MTLPNFKSDYSALGNVSALARPSSDIQHFSTVFNYFFSLFFPCFSFFYLLLLLLFLCFMYIQTKTKLFSCFKLYFLQKVTKQNIIIISISDHQEDPLRMFNLLLIVSIKIRYVNHHEVMICEELSKLVNF